MATDRTLLKQLLQNHILKRKVTLNELYNGQLLETTSGKLLRVFIYRTVSPRRETNESPGRAKFFANSIKIPWRMSRVAPSDVSVPSGFTLPRLPRRQRRAA